MRRLVQTRASKISTFVDPSYDTAGGTPPTYTALGGPMTLSAVQTAVPAASIVTAPIRLGQKAIITYSVELDIAAGDETEVTLKIFDGVASNGIDTFHQTVGISGGEGTVQATVSWTTEVAGDGLAHTYGLSVSDPASLVTIPAFGCRGVVQIVNG
jgi:hypothetical protein